MVSCDSANEGRRDSLVIIGSRDYDAAFDRGIFLAVGYLMSLLLNQTMWASVVCGALVTVSACGPKRLPPASAPVPAKPQLQPPQTPPQPGKGRVYFEVVNDRAFIARVTSIQETHIDVPKWSALSLGNGVVVPVMSGTRRIDAQRITSQPLCGSPCFVDLPLGDHLIQLRSGSHPAGDQVSLRVGDRPIGYKHIIGRNEKPNIGRILGAASLLGLGIGLAVTSPLVYAVDEKTAATAMLISGVAFGIVGYLLYQRARPVQQAGIGTAWSLDDAARTVH